MRQERVIILLNKQEKEILDKEANRLGLPLGSFCRMILIQNLSVKDHNDNSRRPS